MPVVKEHWHEVEVGDLGDPPIIAPSGGEAAVAAHEAAVNPHATYTTAAELSAAVDAAIDALVTGAPGALNTLNELAASIGDDADFAGTITAALAAKVATTRTITAGAGLSGGGDLSANRTVAVDFGEDGDIAAQAFGDAAAAGASGEVADAAHKHAMPKVIRGGIAANGDVAKGTGFTAARTAAGRYTITITAAFAAAPAVLIQPHSTGGTSGITALLDAGAPPTTTEIKVQVFSGPGTTFTDADFEFVAIAV